MENLPPQQEGIFVTRNDQNKALLSITITSLKNLTYDQVKVRCARYSYKEGNFFNYIRRPKKDEVISSEGKIVLDVTDLIDNISFVTDADKRIYVLLVKKGGNRLKDFNEVIVKIKKGETYHINLMGEGF